MQLKHICHCNSVEIIQTHTFSYIRSLTEGIWLHTVPTYMQKFFFVTVIGENTILLLNKILTPL